METKDPKSAESAGAETASEAKDPQADATSSDTLSDVEEAEKATDAGGEDRGTGDNSSAPSPDGAFDEGRREGGLEDAGPM